MPGINLKDHVQWRNVQGDSHEVNGALITPVAGTSTDRVVELYRGIYPGASPSDRLISTLTDSIILLRYVEIFGTMRRALVVLKMRGSHHDADIREYTIDGKGMHIGEPLRSVTGVLSGNTVFQED